MMRHFSFRKIDIVNPAIMLDRCIFFMIREKVLEKSFRPATLTVQMEYTPLPVIDVSHSITPEEFSRNYTSRLRDLYQDEGECQIQF